LTISLGVTNNFELPTLYDGIVNNMSLENIAIKLCEGLDLIPCNLSLTNIEVRLNEMLKKEEVLKRYIDPIKGSYDFVIFDCNPSISSLNRNILNVCNVLDIVCETYPYSMLGMKILFEDLDRFYDVMGMNKPEIVIIPNKYEDRSSLSGEAIALLHKYYGDYVRPNFAIRKSEEFPRSAKERFPISYFCKSNSNAFEDITDLIHLIIEKCKISSSKK
jgi:chromosome partitioning protein